MFMLYRVTYVLNTYYVCIFKEAVMKPTKIIALLVSLLALASLTVACGGASTVKIGMLSPQTGPIAQFAPGFDSAGKVALAELNATHGC